jgi:hypothetical protein
MATTGMRRASDQQPINLSRQRPYPVLELLTSAAEGEQQRALRAAQHCLHRVHQLVHEQRAGLLDADFGDPALQPGQPDDVLAPPAQALGRAVRHVAEFLDDGEDPFPGVRVDQIRAVDDPRHGGRGHAGQVRDLIHRAHPGTRIL